MPELPDITVYLEALQPRIVGQPLEEVRVGSPFLLRTFDPPLEATSGRLVTQLRRIGKRIAIGVEGNLWLVIHLMIAGRLHWRPHGASIGSKLALAAFDFPTGSLLLHEAGSKKRASLHILRTVDLAGFAPKGLEPLQCTFEEYAARLRSENRTLKRALTSPQLFSGIGNSFSDEILHAARLSPVMLTHKLDEAQVHRLFDATVNTLNQWVARLRQQTGEKFPEKVTAFRPEMAVHGKFGQPCPACGKPVQRIRYADNETNYCAQCQTDGQVLADRSLSRLLKQDWPRRIEDWE